MKKILFPILMLLVMMSCDESQNKVSTDLVSNPASADNPNRSDKQPAITFEKTEHDFGKLLKGEVVTYSFKFKNTGDAPLLITGVEKACGCTSSKYDSKPIKPGEEGKIIITFDSSSKKGYQNIRIIVKANTNPSVNILRIKALVESVETF